MEHNKREGHFNGHTWIIVLASVLVLGCIALTEIFVGLEIIKTSNEVAITLSTEITLGTIPLQVVIGIVIIIKRITYIPKELPIFQNNNLRRLKMKQNKWKPKLAKVLRYVLLGLPKLIEWLEKEEE